MHYLQYLPINYCNLFFFSKMKLQMYCYVIQTYQQEQWPVLGRFCSPIQLRQGWVHSSPNKTGERLVQANNTSFHIIA